MHGFMAAAATRNNSYLTLLWRIFAHDDLLLDIDTQEVRMSSLHASQCLFDNIFWPIDQFFHDLSPPGYLSPDIPQGNLCLGDSNHYNDDGGCTSIAIGAFSAAICSSITL